eukprot:1196053-Prorocentrum_minimum.AAC.12
MPDHVPTLCHHVRRCSHCRVFCGLHPHSADCIKIVRIYLGGIRFLIGRVVGLDTDTWYPQIIGGRIEFSSGRVA